MYTSREKLGQEIETFSPISRGKSETLQSIHLAVKLNTLLHYTNKAH